jgi:Putative beta barrel porin-7 (BBP7)
MLALSFVAAIAAGQDSWDRPATLGSYSPVVAGGYPDIYQDEQEAGQQISPSDVNPVQPPATGDHSVANPPFAEPASAAHDSGQLNFDSGCQPCQTGAYPAGYGRESVVGCDDSGSGQRGRAGRLFGSRGQGRRPNCNSAVDPSCDVGLGAGYLDGACEGNASWYSRLRGTGSARCAPARNSDVQTVAGLSGLVFRRDLEDDRGLSYNASGASLFSTDSDFGTAGGAELMIGRRRCSGYGWESRYWELFPERSDVSFGGTPYTALTGLGEIYHTPSAAYVNTFYDRATVHRLYRGNEIRNFEFNALRNGGCFDCGRGTYELLGGFRWFEFDEDLRYATNSTWPGHPVQFNYDTSVANTLLGAQFGGRMERCLRGRWRLSTGLTLGLFNNRIRHSQRMYDEAGGNDAQIFAGPWNGTAYNVRSDKDDLAMLGELNAGVWYLARQNLRFGVGYRAMGISGVALAPDQIPYNFTDLREIERINSNGSLILHGATAGLQYSF